MNATNITHIITNTIYNNKKPCKYLNKKKSANTYNKKKPTNKKNKCNPKITNQNNKNL